MHRVLRAIDHTVVALEAHTARHTAFTLLLRLLLGKADDAFLKVAQNGVALDMHLFAQLAFHIPEMALEKLTMRDDLVAATILVIVYREIRGIRAARLAVVIGFRLFAALV